MTRPASRRWSSRRVSDEEIEPQRHGEHREENRRTWRAAKTRKQESLEKLYAKRPGHCCADTISRSPLHPPIPFFATIGSSASAIRRKTSLQSPMNCLRNRRTVGYQGLSSRSSSQRQSGDRARAIQVGAPSAPARWPSDESHVTTRSRCSITAAVSMKGPEVRSS